MINCPKCGFPVAENTTVCPQCGTFLGGKKESNRNLVVLTIVLAAVVGLFVLGGGGFFVYKNVIQPRQIDKAAPRYYTFAPSVILRSSKVSGADFNKLGSLPYGTELITYNYAEDWSEVKVNAPGADGKKMKGFIASPYILDKRDFFLLNSIFGNEDSKTVISTSKCRRALLEYFKSQGYVGNISAEDAAQLGLPYPSYKNQWQVFCLSKDAKTNNVYYKKLTRTNSKYTDFVVIIKNINSGERKILLFSFDDETEAPRLVVERPALSYGTIKKVSLHRSDPYDDWGAYDYYLVVEYLNEQGQTITIYDGDI